MKSYELIAPCHFGLEAVLKREIIDIGYDVTLVEDGRVTFTGDAEAICRANIFLRSAERILLKVGSFMATTYEELFQGTKALPLDEFIPADGRFWVTKAASVKSRLVSPSDIQSVMKKAMVASLFPAAKFFFSRTLLTNCFWQPKKNRFIHAVRRQVLQRLKSLTMLWNMSTIFFLI